MDHRPEHLRSRRVLLVFRAFVAGEDSKMHNDDGGNHAGSDQLFASGAVAGLA